MPRSTTAATKPPPTLEDYLRAKAAPTPEQRWLGYVREAQESRADLEVSIAIDGIAIMDSLHHEHVGHEVSTRAGRVLRCSCPAFGFYGACAHAALVMVHLWERQMDVDLSEVPAPALVGALLRGYLVPDEERRPAARLGPGRRVGPDGYEETAYSGPEHDEI